MLAGVCLVVLLGACGGSARTDVGKQASGSTVTLERDDVLRVTLGSNRTTGYSWVETPPPDEGVLLLRSDTYVEAESDAVGAAGAQVLEYQAVGPGQSTVDLSYLRPFDPEDVVDRFTLTVTVR
jgi:predicted secreted protein